MPNKKIHLYFSTPVWYANFRGDSNMSEQEYKRRVAAVKVADAINAIEGVPVSEYARELSLCWSKGEITGEEMRDALLEAHKKLAAEANADI